VQANQVIKERTEALLEKPAALLSQMPMELQTDIINVLLVMEFVPSYYFHNMCIYANTNLDF